ncbi:MAG TPA: type IV pilus secretin PilQ [Patescibacteria group bacterium]|nr:type IV pilus secretin PilQ [Patescibacteria group bacterium]
MKRSGIVWRSILCAVLVVGVYRFCASQETPPQEAAPPITDSLAASQNVTLDFKDADINNVLKIIAFKAGVNIVTTPEVIGNVTIKLVEVPWDKALDVILKTHGFGYDRQGNIITVAPMDKLTAMKKQEIELATVQPMRTEVFTLKFIDAQDAKKALEPQLSPRGRITILEMTGQAGWEFGGTELGKRKRLNEEKMGRSKVLIVTDIAPAMDRLKEALAQIDVMQKQVLIEARIMEVSRDKLKDIGFDYGTGQTGAETTAQTGLPLGKTGTMAGKDLVSQVAPAIFGPKASGTSGILGSATSGAAFNTGMTLMYKHIAGTEFEVILHALEEDVRTNTLSSPKLMAMNNQEATILVGTRYPILKTETTGAGSTAVSTITLDYYQDIGIQLNVVPQIGADNTVNMVIHPAVTSYTNTLGTNQYPIIDTREAETRIVIKDGETVVIGGLLKDIKSKGRQGVPFLGAIPVVGALFSRETNDIQKIDLLIFLTARVVKEGEFTPEQIAQMQKNLGNEPKADTQKKPKH